MPSKPAFHAPGPNVPFDNISTLHRESLLSTTAKYNSYISATALGGTNPPEDPGIPAPSLFDFNNSNPFCSPIPQTSSWNPPLIAECAVHLEFLEVLFTIRRRVLNSKKINASMGYASRLKPGQKTIDEWHIGKWKKYVEFAVVRFLIWKDTLPPGVESLSYCPPLDVLMVWHSLLLNPATLHMHFTEDAIVNIKFPWELIHKNLNNHEWELVSLPRDKKDFATITGTTSHLFNMFKKWPVDTIKSRDKTYIGLHNFSFGKSAAEEYRTLLPQKPNDIEIMFYSKAFKNTPVDIAEELRDAVIRQSEFVGKMHDHLWIRCPSLEDTLRRAVVRYDEFLELMKRESGVMLVPTLDIDLIWHTHQCTGSKYADDVRARVGRFINHDDTIGADELDSGFDRTAGFYMKHFGKEYAICGCWECELLTSKMESVVHSGEKIDMSKMIEEIEDKILYYRAVEIARRGKKRLPVARH